MAKKVITQVPRAMRKLKGARYHLTNLANAYPYNKEVVEDEMDAFLSKARSSVDIVLEDANKKFHLGISVKQHLGIKEFRKKAIKKNNAKAQNFLKWYERETKKLFKKDRYGSKLIGPKGRRNISIHRKAVSPDIVGVTIHEQVALKDDVKVFVVKDGEQQEINLNGAPQIIGGQKPQPTASMDLFIKGFESQNILEVLQQLGLRVSDFIERADEKLKSIK
jgi:hypothetical protein